MQMLDDPIYCPRCGHEVDPKWKVCPYCGYDLTQLNVKKDVEKGQLQVPAAPVQSMPPPPHYPTRKKHTGLIIGVVVLILIVVLVPVIYYAILPAAEKATGTTVTTGAIKVIYHSVLGNDIKIYIDDVYMGTYTSDEYHTFYGISPGTHVVTVKSLHDVTLASKEVTVRAGETTTVELHFGSL